MVIINFQWLTKLVFDRRQQLFFYDGLREQEKYENRCEVGVLIIRMLFYRTQVETTPLHRFLLLCCEAVVIRKHLFFYDGLKCQKKYENRGAKSGGFSSSDLWVGVGF
jgi:hypothetical protein